MAVHVLPRVAALLDLEDGSVARHARRERAQLVVEAERAGGPHGAGGDRLVQRHAEPVELRHEFVHAVDETARGRDVDVRADRGGREVLLDGGARHLYVAVHTGVRHIHHDAALGRRPYLRAHLTAAVEDALDVAVEGVREDVAGMEELQHLGQWDGRPADVHHQSAL